MAFLGARRYQDSITAFQKSATIAAWAHAYIAASFACLDQIEQAKPHVDAALRLAPDFTIRQAVTKEPFRQPADLQHVIDAMRRAGLPE